jgi:hypothetical protein
MGPLSRLCLYAWSPMAAARKAISCEPTIGHWVWLPGNMSPLGRDSVPVTGDSRGRPGFSDFPSSRNQRLDQHRFRSLGKLVVSNLDRIADIDNVGNYRSCKRLQLLAPATVSENRCERCHLGLTLYPIKSLVLYEISPCSLGSSGYKLPYRSLEGLYIWRSNRPAGESEQPTGTRATTANISSAGRQ